jgi:hypothetical protein
MKELTSLNQIPKLGLFCLSIGLISAFVFSFHSYANEVKVIQVPRNKPKPGLSPSVPNIPSLPNKLIGQKVSPDRRFVAQLLLKDRGPIYYLAIIESKKQNRRYYLDEQIISGKEYPFNKISVSWKNVNTVLVQALHGSGQKRLLITYNHETGAITRDEQTIKPKVKPKPRYKLPAEALKPVRLDTLDERMQLHRQIPMGVSYEALKQNLPSLGPLQNDAGKNLTEAFLELEVMGMPAKVEFNFKDKVLYSYYYSLPSMPIDKAAEAYQALKDYYSSKYGEFKEEFVQEEPGYAVRQALWETDKAKVNVVNNISGGQVSINWSTSY